MKLNTIRLLAAASLMTLVLAVPATAQTQYLQDTSLSVSPSSSPWEWGDPNDHQTVTDTCAWGGGTTSAARLDPGYGIAQTFTVGSAWTSYAIRLDTYFGDAGGGSNDAIEVYVTNLDTSAYEYFSFNAGSYGTCASVVAFNLANDYDNADVQVVVRRHNSSQSTMTIDVDNIAFFGRPY